LGAAEHLVKFLPVPVITRDGDLFRIDYNRSDAIGRIHSFYGNFSICLRAYIYIRMLGCDGLRDVSDTAVLNANYLMSQLRDIFNVPINRRCMHEFILNDRGFRMV
jgi:glycine dehydrogenase subunit 2